MAMVFENRFNDYYIALVAFFLRLMLCLLDKGSFIYHKSSYNLVEKYFRFPELNLVRILFAHLPVTLPQ